ncbi:MAG: DUF421 domain-containing protein [Heliobacteriaceae bacterium]|nr:DUF421 domain-containing protein [Heliobacteriaceae bacterium]MDD4587822.1 DUF421 domain-containing protein [Heliobacteriaceae bacterium]
MNFPEVFSIVFRTLVIYVAVLVILRIMGKREIGQLSPVDLVVAIMIAELAAIPMEDLSMPLHHAFIPIVVLMAAEIVLSYIALKWPGTRSWFSGRPTVIIRDGRILEAEMRRTRYNLDDLLAQLREKNVVDVQDVEVAILENSGQLSVIPKSQKRPVTPADLRLTTEYEGLPLPLVMDGRINDRNLRLCRINREWLADELAKQGVDSAADVFFASLDTAGKLAVYPRASSPPK